MKVSEHIYAKRMYFKASTPAGVMTRNVFIYLITGKNGSCLIDTGVASSVQDVLDFIASAGKTPEDITQILLTHSHVDHIGGLHALKEALHCPAAASAGSQTWIENIDEQFAQRPVPQFYEFVKESTALDRLLAAGDTIDLGDSTLVVYEAPGHDKGQLAFYHKEDGALMTADSIPVPGEMPVYSDLTAQWETLHRLKAIENVRVLLPSWDDPRKGTADIHKYFAAAISYVRRIHTLTQEALTITDGSEDAAADYVHSRLELPPSTRNMLFLNTIRAHIHAQEINLQIL